MLGLGFPEGAGLGVPAEELEDAMLLEPLEAGVLLLEVEDALLLELPLGETELSSFFVRSNIGSQLFGGEFQVILFDFGGI